MLCCVPCIFFGRAEFFLRIFNPRVRKIAIENLVCNPVSNPAASFCPFCMKFGIKVHVLDEVTTWRNPSLLKSHNAGEVIIPEGHK